MTDTLLAKFKTKRLPGWLFWLLLAVLVAARLAIAASQRIWLDPMGSGLDDMLMIRGAMSITEGQWLGAYHGAAIAKHMGFSVWLALLHALGVPVLLGNAALWLAACGFTVWALRPAVPGNLARLCVFAFFAFVPVGFAHYTIRVYRDGIFMAISLLFFAGVLGLGLRLQSGGVKGSVASALVAGLGLAAAGLTREDGVLLLAYAVCGLALVLLFALFGPKQRHRAAKTACAVLPFVLLGVGVLAFSAGNNAHFGVFMVSDMSSGSFGGAYGALAGVSRAESGFTHRVPVTRQALQKLYREVPTMAQLQPELERKGVVYNGYANHTTHEYGGSFYYALRAAAHNQGLTPTAPAAQSFWARMQAEVDAAVAEGRLQSVKPSASTIPLWDASLLVPTGAEVKNGVLHLLTFQDCDPRPEESSGTEAQLAPLEAYLHSKLQRGYIEGTSIPYYNPLQRAVFAFCDVLVWVYRVLVWPLLALALYQFGRRFLPAIGALFKRRAGPGLLYGTLLLGLLLSFLARMGVAAYMEVAAFGIGTYLMYLAGGVPPLLLFIVGAALWPGFGQEASENKRTLKTRKE